MAKLTRTQSKSGKYYTFSIPGVRGQLHIAPKMLQGACPTSIEVIGIEFAEAGVEDAAKVALAAEKAAQALVKAQERVAKAQAKLAAVAPTPVTGEGEADAVAEGDVQEDGEEEDVVDEEEELVDA